MICRILEFTIEKETFMLQCRIGKQWPGSGTHGRGHGQRKMIKGAGRDAVTPAQLG